MSGGGGGGIPIVKEIPILRDIIPGARGGDVQAGGAALPPHSGDMNYAKNHWKSKIQGDSNLDEVARTDLLSQIDVEGFNPDLLSQKYQDILDPETKSGKDMLYRKERTKQKERPGLKAQTNWDSFFSSAVGTGGFFR